MEFLLTDEESRILYEGLVAGAPDAAAKAVVEILTSRESRLNATIAEQTKLIGELSVDRDRWLTAAKALHSGIDRIDDYTFSNAMTDVSNYKRAEEERIRREEREKRIEDENQRRKEQLGPNPASL